VGAQESYFQNPLLDSTTGTVVGGDPEFRNLKGAIHGASQPAFDGNGEPFDPDMDHLFVGARETRKHHI
jgi:hypothetical protein